MSKRKPIILYVDDDPDYREVVRTMLESGGYEMVEAATGEEGLQVYKERKPDLVIVDLMMEEVDSGTSLIKELKALGNKAPIYMLSAVGDQMNRNIPASDLGLSGIFQKPLDIGTLLITLKTKLSK